MPQLMHLFVRRVVALTVVLTCLFRAEVATGGGTNDEASGHFGDDEKENTKLAFLEECHSSSFSHESGELKEHLIGTSALLEDWGLPLYVVDAGLFHSVYGTEAFHLKPADNRRPDVRRVIGEDAEALVWAFGQMNRSHFQLQVANYLASPAENSVQVDSENEKAIVLHCRKAWNTMLPNSSGESQPLELIVSRRQLKELAAIKMADTVEIMSSMAKSSKRRVKYKQRLSRELNAFRTIVPKKAYLHAENILRLQHDPFKQEF